MLSCQAAWAATASPATTAAHNTSICTPMVLARCRLEVLLRRTISLKLYYSSKFLNYRLYYFQKYDTEFLPFDVSYKTTQSRQQASKLNITTLHDRTWVVNICQRKLLGLRYTMFHIDTRSAIVQRRSYYLWEIMHNVD
ncbi:hypothetical protein OTU49_000526 [Cherax quadricarinatus]|uniref:Secreted protein n=1 Tax=Cherax quadricarinatus TaxID=27406 RepID=A0AAW0XJ94_CHEQU